jgi:hypothetical protein
MALIDFIKKQVADVAKKQAQGKPLTRSQSTLLNKVKGIAKAPAPTKPVVAPKPVAPTMPKLTQQPLANFAKKPVQPKKPLSFLSSRKVQGEPPRQSTIGFISDIARPLKKDLDDIAKYIKFEPTAQGLYGQTAVGPISKGERKAGYQRMKEAEFARMATSGTPMGILKTLSPGTASGVESFMVNAEEAVVSGVRLAAEELKGPKVISVDGGKWGENDEQTLDAVIGWSEKEIKDTQKLQQLIVKNIPDHWLQQSLFKLTSGGMSLAAGAGIYAITKNPTLATAFMTGVDVLPEYNRAREEGLSPRQARNVVLESGAYTYLLERMGLEILFGGPAKSLIGNFAKGFAGEAGTEGLQTVSQNYVAGKSYDENREWWEGVIESVIIGGIVGGGVSSLVNLQPVVEKQLMADGVVQKDASIIAKDLIDYIQERGASTIDSFAGENRLAFTPEGIEKGIRPGIEKPAALPEQFSKILRGTKGMTAEDITATHPDIQLKRDVPAKDIHGNKVIIPEGEALTPYELKGNKVLLQDGVTYIVSKNQYQNIKNNAVSGEATEFAPELKGTEETVRGEKDPRDLQTITDELFPGRKFEDLNSTQAITVRAGQTKNFQSGTKYSQYTLPEGKNYQEILIKAPAEGTVLTRNSIKEVVQNSDGGWDVKIEDGRKFVYDDAATAAEARNEFDKDLRGGKINVGATDKSVFRSSHWDEPNVIAHIRSNMRKYLGKDVYFLEELQSDWMRALRDEAKEKTKVNGVENREKANEYVRQALAGEIKTDTPVNQMLKNWEIPSLKRALQEAVAKNAEYFAWINGEQTSARYDLATHVDNVEWSGGVESGDKWIKVFTKDARAVDGGKLNFVIDKNGTITQGKEGTTGKKLDEVLGKGLADSIMGKDKGSLSGEGLKFGGEWATNLYDKQVGNIVSDLTGAKVIEMDMGLPVEADAKQFYLSDYLKDVDKTNAEDIKTALATPESLTVGRSVTEGYSGATEYIITEVLGEGKFKAVPYARYWEADRKIDNIDEVNKETFDLSTKTTVQQGIKLTPEIKARIKGEAPGVKASGKMFDILDRQKLPKTSLKDTNYAFLGGEKKITPEQLATRDVEPDKIPPQSALKAILHATKPPRPKQPTVKVTKRVIPENLSGFDNFMDIGKTRPSSIQSKGLDIAEIVRDDKTFPAIRKSGFYATKGIDTAPVEDVYNQTLSPYHMALKQDKHVRGGKFGEMFKKVWLPTEQAILDSKKFATNQIKIIEELGIKHNIKATKKNLRHLSDVMEEKVKGTPEEKLYAKELREVLDGLRDQANKVREAMGKDTIGYIKDYIPHIQKTTLWNELLNNEATISDNLDFIIPNEAKNPFAHKRLLEELPKSERNLYLLLDRYVDAIGKDIYITPAIENIKAYNNVLKNRELFNAAKYWDEYIRTGLLSKQHKIDSAIGVGEKGRKASQKWNNMVNLAFLTGKVGWTLATQPLSYIMNMPMEVGVRNSVKAIFKSFSTPLREFVKENSKVLNIKNSDVHAVAVGEGRNIQNRIYRTKIDKWNDFISILSSIGERELTLAAYVGGLDRAMQLGYEGEDALAFADLAAARTQSMYNRENRALILNSDITRTVFPFQSFAIEMYNHSKEILTKTKGAERLNKRQRYGKLFRLLMGIYLSGLYAEKLTGRKKTSLGTFIPFLGAYADMYIKKAQGDEYYGGRSPITVVQVGSDVIKGAKDFIEHGNAKKLRKVALNFGLALGGIGGGAQLNNIIDGLMLSIDEEVKAVDGDTLFSTDSALDKVIAPIFGVWATQAGREYWEPTETKKSKTTSIKF